MFYEFRQNNSGGYWIGAKTVIIEADSAIEANEIATTASESPIYFNGVSLGRDCECCGSRWYPLWEDDKGVWGDPITEENENVLVIRKKLQGCEHDFHPAKSIPPNDSCSKCKCSDVLIHQGKGHKMKLEIYVLDIETVTNDLIDYYTETIVNDRAMVKENVAAGNPIVGGYIPNVNLMSDIDIADRFAELNLAEKYAKEHHVTIVGVELGYLDIRIVFGG